MSLAEDSLRHYVEQAWHIVEPSTPFIGGWHIDAMCEHLQAVSRGEILRLLITMPPRHAKSLIVGVFWPSWTWGPHNKPSLRFLYSSYAEHLSKRDSLKTRRIIQSPWYRGRWGDRFKITSDQNEKLRFENDRTGYRVATSVGGVGTGEGGDCVVSDDSHNVLESESDTKRSSVLTWWDESMSTRLNDPHKGAKVIVMQRSHYNDLAGHVLEKEAGYVHLCLPARYEGENRIVSPLPIVDPRTEIGEPLWPGLYDEAALKKLEGEMTIYSVAAQLQQRPSPRGGGMFEIDKFVVLQHMPPKEFVDITIRYWDKASTDQGGCMTAGVRMSKMKESYSGPRYIVSDVVSGHWASGVRESTIKQTAQLDGISVAVWHEMEPGSSGKDSAESTTKNLAGFRVAADRVTGNKVTRAEPYSSQANVGNVGIVRGSWNKDFLEQHEHFPVGKLKDIPDSAAGAFNKIEQTFGKRAGTFGQR